MVHRAYYNEIDPEKAEWIRELIKARVIAPGDVDERDIKLVQPEDLRGYRQCHFFAGIAVWSYALRLAGWPDDKHCWTGSCPCGPFSIAGKQQAFADERHLWPEWFYLIEKCRPRVVWGEQVEAAAKCGWLDLVQDDVEAIDYAFWPAALPAASAGAYHIRPRIFFVADTESERIGTGLCNRSQAEERRLESADCGGDDTLAISMYSKRGPVRRFDQRCAVGAVGHSSAKGLSHGESSDLQRQRRREEGRAVTEPSQAFNPWRECEWVYCRDGKFRPVPRAIESELAQMADGLASDMGLVRFQSYSEGENEEAIVYSPLIARGRARTIRLRGYGDAIVPQVAKAFIEAYCEARGILAQ